MFVHSLAESVNNPPKTFPFIFLVLLFFMLDLGGCHVWVVLLLFFFIFLFFNARNDLIVKVLVPHTERCQENQNILPQKFLLSLLAVSVGRVPYQVVVTEGLCSRPVEHSLAPFAAEMTQRYFFQHVEELLRLTFYLWSGLASPLAIELDKFFVETRKEVLRKFNKHQLHVSIVLLGLLLLLLLLRSLFPDRLELVLESVDHGTECRSLEEKFIFHSFELAIVRILLLRV